MGGWENTRWASETTTRSGVVSSLSRWSLKSIWHSLVPLNSRIAFFLLQIVSFPSKSEIFTTIPQSIKFQGLFTETNNIRGKWKTSVATSYQLAKQSITGNALVQPDTHNCCGVNWINCWHEINFKQAKRCARLFRFDNKFGFTIPLARKAECFVITTRK